MFSDVAGCRKFVYKVRNNIFMAPSALGETWDTDHARRIQLYLDFSRCLNLLFFLVLDTL